MLINLDADKDTARFIFKNGAYFDVYSFDGAIVLKQCADGVVWDQAQFKIKQPSVDQQAESAALKPVK